MGAAIVSQGMDSQNSKRSSNANSAAVTLDMVARLAQVSPSTVSRILNGTATVSEEKKKAVDEAISKLRFVPNPIARGLAGGKTMSIGVITQALDSPFYGVAMSSIEAELDPAGYSALYVSGDWNAKTEARCIDILLSRRVDGIIVLMGRLSDQVLKSCAKKVPTVVSGRSLHAKSLFSLNSDNFEGGRLATQHLIDLGHQKIAFIAGDMHHPDANERLRGYRSAIESAGLEFDPKRVLQGDFRETSGVEAVQKLIASKAQFSAIFAANDQMALGAALGLHQNGLRIPHDVSLVGFDDLPVAAYTLPPLTSVHESAEDIGRLSARAVIALINGHKPTFTLPEPKLVIRASTAACR